MFCKIFKKKNIQKETITGFENQADLSKEFDTALEHKISLSKELVVTELNHKNISNQKSRIVFALDHSLSLSWAYDDGTIQNITERLFPIAMQMDDNEEMDFKLFDDGYVGLEKVTMQNLDNYVDNIVKKRGGYYGGTSYAPIINAITDEYGTKNQSNVPTFVIFITDGDNGDREKAEKAIIKASYHNIFWKFIGIGDSNFSFLKNLDDMSGRMIDNADFIRIENLNKTKDRELYRKLFNEYDVWLSNWKNISYILKGGVT